MTMAGTKNFQSPVLSQVTSLVKFLNPERIVSQLEISSEMTVAHFGCGGGYFTFAIARKMGGSGIVYALDILPEKIEAVKSQAKLSGLFNVLAKRASLEEKEGSKITSETVDWVIVVNMLYQNEKKSRIIGEAKRILKESGRILVVDWKADPKKIGPDIKIRVSREEIIKIARKHELRIIREMELSDFHFGLILAK